VLIRTATAGELTRYERFKLAGIEEKAQVNKLESISVNGETLLIDPETKNADIKLGDLAFKSEVDPDDVSLQELFFIKCELDDSELLNN
jgi:hypothetical protein